MIELIDINSEFKESAENLNSERNNYNFSPAKWNGDFGSEK